MPLQGITIIQATEKKLHNSRYLSASDVKLASPAQSVDLLFHGQGKVKGDTKALHFSCKGNPTAYKINGTSQDSRQH